MVVALCLATAPFALRRPGILTNPNGGGATAGAGPVIRASPRFVRLSPHWVNQRMNYAVLSESPAVAADEEGDLPFRDPEDLIVPAGQVVVNHNKTELSIDDSMRYLTNILTSKVYDVAEETPLEKAKILTEKMGKKCNFWMKREDRQPVFSFKLRGAYNMMSKLTPDQRATGVITASAGNHAQGVALSASRLKCTARIVMPKTAPDIKVEAVKRFGGEWVIIDQQGETFDEAQAYALRYAEDHNLVYIPPFDAEDVLLGNGTVAAEIVKEMGSKNIDTIFVPVGGGGLVSGVAAYIKSIKPEVKVIGVEPAFANSMALSIKEGQRIELTYTQTLADGVAVKVIGKSNFAIAKQVLDGVVLVSEANIAAALKDVFDENRSILEPSGAVALAGAKAYCSYPANNVQPEANMVAILSGANMDFEKLPTIVELSGIGQGTEALLSTVLPGDHQESLKKFFGLLGNSFSITEFNYSVQTSNGDSVVTATIMYKISFKDAKELNDLIDKLNANNLTTINLSGNIIVHEHLKNMSVGRAKVKDELLARFVVPERPGALKDLVNNFSPYHKISKISYRYQGEAKGNVLIGLEVPENKVNLFHERAKNLKWEYRVHSDNKGYKFLQGL